MNNSRQAIKHIELMQEQIQALEQHNEKLTKQLNTAICLLCSNKASVIKEPLLPGLNDGENERGWQLEVEELNGTETGAFSPESTPYQAVLTGIDEYIEYNDEYMADNNV